MNMHARVLDAPKHRGGIGDEYRVEVVYRRCWVGRLLWGDRRDIYVGCSLDYASHLNNEVTGWQLEPNTVEWAHIQRAKWLFERRLKYERENGL